LPPWARPLVTEKLLNVTAPPPVVSTKKMRYWLLPLMIEVLPLIVSGTLMIGRGLKRVTRLPEAKLIVPPPAVLASVMAWRRELGPESAGVVTVKVAWAPAVRGTAAIRRIVARAAATMLRTEAPRRWRMTISLQWPSRARQRSTRGCGDATELLRWIGGEVRA
jgi:hypothetical protein